MVTIYYYIPPLPPSSQLYHNSPTRLFCNFSKPLFLSCSPSSLYHPFLLLFSAHVLRVLFLSCIRPCTSMENFGSFGFDGVNRSAKKKRSLRLRGPIDDSQSCLDNRDNLSLSSTPLSDSLSRQSSDENVNQSVSRASNTNLSENASKMVDEVGRLGESNEAGITKLKKVKLKVGGVTHTLHTKTASEGSTSAGTSSKKSFHSSDGVHARHKLIRQDGANEGRITSKNKRSGLRGIPWKDFSKSGFIFKKEDIPPGRMTEQIVSVKHSGTHELSRKSKRIPKKRSLGDVFDDGEDNNDDEIRYLEKVRRLRLGSSHGAEYVDVDEVGGRKQQVSRFSHDDVYGNDIDPRYYNSSSSGKESKKSRSTRASDDTDYFEDEDSLSDIEPEPKKKHSLELIDVSGEFKREMAITTRQRALKSGRFTSSSSGASLIEFPNGLPPAPPKKQKEKLSEVEQQLKKAEAAQRRRMQVEKAAREAEAEAIRKILGQDSSRKKQEEKFKRRQEELAQERAANTALASNAVRWVIGPSGTTVTFPDEIGLPSILESKPCSYPPPREICAGPSCTNAYKYRDSKSKLPLCSLGCYKAIHEKMQTTAACLI